MIAGLLVAALLQAGIPEPSVLTVRAGASEAVVPIVRTSHGRAVRLDGIAPIVPTRIEDEGGGRYTVTFAGVRFTVTEHSPFMTLGERVIPLAAAPWTEEGRLYLPLQAITDQLPRAAPEKLRYNPVRGELRLLAAGSTVASAASRGSPAVAAAAPTRPRAGGATSPSRAASSRSQARRVVVDAGHGGPDRGMTGPIGRSPKIHEKDITLAVARRLAAELKQRGVTVVMTRTKDTLIALSDRGRIANQSEGDLFISIHVNAANMRWKRPQDARGFETYFLSEAKTEDARRVEQMENESVRFETGVHAPKDDPLSFIINDMAQNEHLRESNDLASTIQERLAGMHPGPSRGVKQANFAVLRTSFMPAVLVEIGFGTNAEEAKWMGSPSRQQEIAAALADATVEYLEHYERRIGAAGR
jgi:N-acetylmuramoyl-L-alanine amidase